MHIPDTGPPWRWPRAAYIHIPFCAHLCGYCDFAVAVGLDQRIDDYFDALAVELSSLGRPQPVRTLFCGGGTPTHLSASQLARLLDVLLRWLPLLPDHEFTVEANPGTLHEDKIRILADHGVNRLSLGAQSFNPKMLHVLERDHQPADVFRAVELARRAIPRISLDLIFGVPGQQPDDWQFDMEEALKLEPVHLSTYGLTYEKGTRLWRQRQTGEVRALSEDTELVLYTQAMDYLAAQGFEHYEISNFARPGQRCRHNQVYWANHAYFGFGMGAARYVEGVRQTNTRNLADYLKRARTGQAFYFQSEELPPRERALETVAVQLRRCEGIDRHQFQDQTGIALDELVGPTVKRLTDLALLENIPTHVSLTRAGKCVADSVIAELMKDFA